MFTLICRVIYTHDQRFATHEKTKLPLYTNLIPNPRAFAMDALSLLLDNLFIYASPPTNILSEVLGKIAKPLVKCGS